jgi:hypothetical protein
MAASDARAASQSVVLVVRAGLPNCCAVIYLGAGPGGVFLGKPEKTAAQVQICAIAGEAAATLGLFEDRETAPSHSLAT